MRSNYVSDWKHSKAPSPRSLLPELELIDRELGDKDEISYFRSKVAKFVQSHNTHTVKREKEPLFADVEIFPALIPFFSLFFQICISLSRVASLIGQEQKVRLINAEITDAPVPPLFPPHFLVLVRFAGDSFRINCSSSTTLYQLISEVLLI